MDFFNLQAIRFSKKVKKDAILKWNQNGFYVLPNVFSKKETSEIIDEANRFWTSKSDVIVVDRQIYSESEVRVRKQISNLTPEEQRYRYVLNDLYLESSVIRKAALKKEIVQHLDLFMGAKSVLWQSLNFRWGTEIGYHQDTLYLPPSDEKSMVAIWIALEDVKIEAGPLKYIVGSHAIPHFRFSDGSIRLNPTEAGDWDRYMKNEINKRNLKEETFLAKRGDVLFWHAWLMHGGMPILNKALTRNSLVCHFYATHDSKAEHCILMQEGDGLWFKRKHNTAGI